MLNYLFKQTFIFINENIKYIIISFAIIEKFFIKKRIDKWKIDKLSNNTNMEFIHQSEINKLSF